MDRVNWRSLFLIVIASLLGGCSVANEMQCRSWHNDGLVQGTVSSCTQCLDQLGGSSTDAISGCALGMDAAQLMTNASQLSN